MASAKTKASRAVYTALCPAAPLSNEAKAYPQRIMGTTMFTVAINSNATSTGPWSAVPAPWATKVRASPAIPAATHRHEIASLTRPSSSRCEKTENRIATKAESGVITHDTSMGASRLGENSTLWYSIEAQWRAAPTTSCQLTPIGPPPQFSPDGPNNALKDVHISTRPHDARKQYGL